MSTSNQIPREGDIVVAGGGTTGIIVASRLAKADPTLSMLVLEHGPDVRDNPQIVNPALFITNILPESKTATFYTAEPSKYLNGRQAIVPTGGCLGGDSPINFLVYVRPQEIDFDDWKTEGWSGKEMITFFKFENFQDTDPKVDASIQGYGGELSVSPGSNVHEEFQQDFFQACEVVGTDRVADVQDFKTSNAVGKWNSWVDKNNGTRQNVPHGFLYPILDAKDTGLRVATEVKVGRILFEKGPNRANGVEYFTSNSSKPQVVYSQKQIILAAGTLGSPQIPERSRVGSSTLLSQGSIHIKSTSPFEAPEFNPGYLSNLADIEQILYSYKIQQEITRHLSHCYRPLETTHPKFPPESKASYEYVDNLSTEKGFPVPIKYTPKDEEIIRDYIHQSVRTTWHSISTCSMKKRENGGVVDERLNVYGVKGLKVVSPERQSTPTRGSRYSKLYFFPLSY